MMALICILAFAGIIALYCIGALILGWITLASGLDD